MKQLKYYTVYIYNENQEIIDEQYLLAYIPRGAFREYEKLFGKIGINDSYSATPNEVLNNPCGGYTHA